MPFEVREDGENSPPKKPKCITMTSDWLVDPPPPPPPPPKKKVEVKVKN